MTFSGQAQGANLRRSGGEGRRPLRVVVVGGGVTGLAAAYRLTQLHVPVTILEATSRVGGKIQTERVDGFLVEAGADTFLSRKPEALTLAVELGLREEIIGTVPGRRAFVSWRDKLLPLPPGMSGLVAGRNGDLLRSGLLSPWGRVRALAERYVPARDGDAEETVAQFATRRFGREVYERVLEPLMCGISGGDGTRLSAAAVMPTLVGLEREWGSIREGQRRASPPQNVSPPFLSFKSGMNRLVDALVNALPPDTIVHAAPVVGLERVGASSFCVTAANGYERTADAVVLATPHHEAANLLRGIAPDASDALNGIRLGSSATVSLAYPAEAIPRSLDGTGYLIPRVLGRSALACTWSSSKLAGRAPQDHVLLRVYLGGGREGFDVGADQGTLAAQAQEELRLTLGVTAPPSWYRVFTYDEVMPLYEVGHAAAVARAITALDEVPGVAVAGASYLGVGISDCIRSAERAVSKVAP